MIAVIPVRDGQVPAGGLETIAECGGAAVLAGSSPDADTVADVATTVCLAELGAFQAARWADALEPLLRDWRVVALPASPDGRDLAPRLAHRLGRRLLAGATAISADRAALARNGGLSLLDITIDEPVVATLQPGIRGVVISPESTAVPVTNSIDAIDAGASMPAEPELVGVVAPDVTTMDLREAIRVVAGGAGLDSSNRFDQLADLARSLGAAMGATRVITDRGWVGHERQIGTTGVVVDPQLYLAFGISGAVQHTAGLGAPDHIVSVNIDPYCPMMEMADLAVVSDANAVVDELQRLLAGRHTDE